MVRHVPPPVQAESAKLLGVSGSLFRGGSFIVNLVCLVVLNLVWAIASLEDLPKAQDSKKLSLLVPALPLVGSLASGRWLAVDCKHHAGRDCVCLGHYH